MHEPGKSRVLSYIILAKGKDPLTGELILLLGRGKEKKEMRVPENMASVVRFAAEDNILDIHISQDFKIPQGRQARNKADLEEIRKDESPEVTRG